MTGCGADHDKPFVCLLWLYEQGVESWNLRTLGLGFSLLITRTTGTLVVMTRRRKQLRPGRPKAAGQHEERFYREVQNRKAHAKRAREK